MTRPRLKMASPAFHFEGTVETTCEGDADGDGQIGILDLLAVLDSFGSYCE